MALVGMSSLAKEMRDQERKRVVEEILSEGAPVLQSYSNGSGLAFELSANLATAKGQMISLHKQRIAYATFDKIILCTLRTVLAALRPLYRHDP
ncbi:MAG: hypothetical protein E5V24_04905 [Mesorhizobium sp.]|nr:MAG: hypothetical protein E5V24_04905 [Mesorhizobium sp.]